MEHAIGILILHWRDKERTLGLLQEILSWDKISFHLYLIQNETKEDLFHEIESARITKIISPKNLGFSGGNNLGLQKSIEANHAFSFLLNPDASIQQSALIKLLEAANAEDKLFSISPVINETSLGESRQYLGGKNIATYRQTRILEEEVLAELGESQLMEVFYNIGAAMLINNKALQKVGLLDTDYFFSGEIADICQRARDHDFRCLTLLDTEASHTIEEHKLRSSLYRYYSLRNRFLFIKKHKQFKKSKNKWRKELIKEFTYAALKFNLKNLRTMSICASDVILGRYGNRNNKFIKQIERVN